MSDKQSKGDEPSLGGYDEHSGREPSIGGAGMRELLMAIKRIPSNRNDLRAQSSQFDPRGSLDNRIIWLTSEITEQLVRQVIAQLLFHDRERSDVDIILIVGSLGGLTYPAFAIVDTMKTLSSPITTVGVERVGGAAILPLIAGQKGKRYLTSNCRIAASVYREHTFSHDISSPRLDELKRKLDSYLLEYTAISEQELTHLRNEFLTTEEAIRFGYADHVIQINAK
jgi:ATP-dependent Clp protease, protease subunit